MSAAQTRLNLLLAEYGSSHQNGVNKFIHWICVPAIMFSLVGILMAIPVFWETKTWYNNFGAIVLFLALIYYWRLSRPLTVYFLFIALALLYGNWKLFGWLGWNTTNLLYWSLGIFAVAWVGQFIGHKIEGKKPSFLKDLQFLLIGPAWLLSFIVNPKSLSGEQPDRD